MLQNLLLDLKRAYGPQVTNDKLIGSEPGCT